MGLDLQSEATTTPARELFWVTLAFLPSFVIAENQCKLVMGCGGQAAAARADVTGKPDRCGYGLRCNRRRSS